MSQFVHLSLHTEYSLVDSVIRVKALAATVRELGMGAVGVSDVANMYGAYKFQVACVDAGVKPLFGAEVYLVGDDAQRDGDRMLLFCRNKNGFQALSRLLSRAYLEGQTTGRACIHETWLAGECKHLIALSGGVDGVVGRDLVTGQRDRATARLTRYLQLFDDRFYMELSRVGHEDEAVYLNEAVDLATTHGVPVVATNRVCFISPADFSNHEVRVCINEGRILDDSRRQARHHDQQYLKSPQQMQALFADLPEALANTVEIAKRCNMRLETGKTYLPDFPMVENRSPEQALAAAAEAGLTQNLSHRSLTPEQRQVYDARLQRELDVINGMGYASYFLIVADFIAWARQQRIPVGPGRGSGAGSLVAWVTGITELDPIEHVLLFERFLNPERVSLPDFDIDFCMDGRDRVIEYVNERYGRDRVAQIVTHGTMAARAVVRDVGRVSGHPYGFVDTLAKQVPFEIGMTLDKAIDREEILRERIDNEPEVKELLETGRALEGLCRNVGKHAGGVVIAPAPLTDYTPLYLESGGTQAVTQLDKDDLEAIGLVKFDFLGLRTLTIIDRAERAINARRTRQQQPPVALDALSTDDAKAYALLAKHQTGALFQLESHGMRALVQRLKPDRFDDVVALLALFRPGPLQSGMVDDFVDRKHGHKAIEYPHPDLEPILAPTYGVILYQEQVMQIAQVLAGYTLGAADLLRRAMGKKKPEEMAKQRQVFVDGATGRGVDRDRAGYIFDLMEKFAGYGFNKSHSAAYALITYRTAWLKAHYPAEFMAAALSSDMDNTDRVVALMHECREMNIEVAAPDINHSEHAFTAVSDQRILYGLGAVKGVGKAAVDQILSVRAERPFTGLFDFCERLNARKVNRRTIESLIASGAFDDSGQHRASLMASLTNAMSAADQQHSDRDAGQEDLFGVQAESVSEAAVKDVAPWSGTRRLQAEKEALGLYLSGHPIERYRDELLQVTGTDIRRIQWSEERSVTIAGIVSEMRVLNTRRGDKMAFIWLDDGSARVEINISPEVLKLSLELIRKDQLLVVAGTASFDERSGMWQLRCQEINDLAGFREHYLRRITLTMGAPDFANGIVRDLETILADHRPGNTEVLCRYTTREGDGAMLRFGEDWRVTPSSDFVEKLCERFREEDVNMDYTNAPPRTGEDGYGAATHAQSVR